MWRPSYYSDGKHARYDTWAAAQPDGRLKPRHAQHLLFVLLPIALTCLLFLRADVAPPASDLSLSPGTARLAGRGAGPVPWRPPSPRHFPLYAEPEPVTPTTYGVAVDTLPKHFTSTTFASLPLSPLLKASLDRMGLVYATDIQLACLGPALEGKDLLAQGRTGTGKTLAFLIPLVEQLLRYPPDKRFISAVVLSPTRELAMQIYHECERLVEGTPLRVMDMVGGTSKVWDNLSEARKGVDIIVATPGRLRDLMKNNKDLRYNLRYLRIVVLDETDRLLDYGFWKDIEKMSITFPNPSDRQTFLFSATIPATVIAKADIVTRVSNRAKVRLVREEEAFVHDHVEQHVMVVPMRDQILTLVTLMRGEMWSRYYKILVFFPTTRLTQLWAELFNMMGFSVMEMHSVKGPVHRSRVSDQFMKLRNVIMFSSDVSARGMDYPGVTLVVQMGLPSSVNQYIHRLGRTGRGKSMAGRGALILADFEAPAIKHFRACGLREVLPPEPRPYDEEVVRTTLPKLGRRVKEMEEVYLSWLGFYKTMGAFHNQTLERIVAEANNFFPWLYSARCPPSIDILTAGKMRVRYVPGITLRDDTGALLPASAHPPAPALAPASNDKLAAAPESNPDPDPDPDTDPDPDPDLKSADVPEDAPASTHVATPAPVLDPDRDPAAPTLAPF